MKVKMSSVITALFMIFVLVILRAADVIPLSMFWGAVSGTVVGFFGNLLTDGKK